VAANSARHRATRTWRSRCPEAQRDDTWKLTYVT
jgi:hypothetical protein